MKTLFLCLSVIAIALGAARDVPEVPEAEWKIMESGGLRAIVPALESLNEVYLHFNINKELSGVSAGDYNIMISSPGADGSWVYEDPAIEVKDGDTVYYWILIMVNGGGYQKTDLSFVLHNGEPTTSTTTEATTPTTTTSTTTSTTTTIPTTTAEPLPEPMFELMEPEGLRVWIADPDSRVMYFAFHMNINDPLNGVDFGDFNYAIDQAGPDGNWTIEEPSVSLNDSDIVYYWYYIAVDGEGHEVTDNMWSPGGPLTTTTEGSTTESIPDIISVTETSEGKYYEPGELVFEDNFDFLDSFKWEHEITMAGGGNWEFQMYTHNRTNSYTRDGILYLKPTLTADKFSDEFIRTERYDMWGGQPGDRCTMAGFYGCERQGGADGGIINPIMSARLRTAKYFTFMYGKVEVRAKTPRGDWLWPAIWMLPVKHAYGQWPASGEIDIMESKGNSDYKLDGQDIGRQLVGSTLHYGGGYPENGWPNAHYEKSNAAGFDEEFHKYQVNWTPEFIEFSVDDEPIGKVLPPEGGFWELGEWHESTMQSPWRFAKNPKMAPFDQQFFMVLNLAVGGTEYFPDEAVNAGGKPWRNDAKAAATDFWNAKDQWLPTWNLDENNGEDAAMAVDYVKIWASDVVKTD